MNNTARGKRPGLLDIARAQAEPKLIWAPNMKRFELAEKDKELTDHLMKMAGLKMVNASGLPYPIATTLHKHMKNDPAALGKMHQAVYGGPPAEQLYKPTANEWSNPTLRGERNFEIRNLSTNPWKDFTNPSTVEFRTNQNVLDMDPQMFTHTYPWYFENSLSTDGQTANPQFMGYD